ASLMAQAALGAPLTSWGSTVRAPAALQKNALQQVTPSIPTAMPLALMSWPNPLPLGPGRGSPVKTQLVPFQVHFAGVWRVFAEFWTLPVRNVAAPVAGSEARPRAAPPAPESGNTCSDHTPAARLHTAGWPPMFLPLTVVPSWSIAQGVPAKPMSWNVLV